jgi:hypothetical protein
VIIRSCVRVRLQAVRGEEPEDDFSEYIGFQEARRTRRVALVASGKAAARCSGFPGRKIGGGKTKLHRLVRKIALQRGFSIDLNAVEAYGIVGGEIYANAMKARDVKQKVFVAMHQKNAGEKATKVIPSTRILVAHAQNDRMTGVHEYTRR